MFGLGIFHLAPYEVVWPIVLYYICTFGLLVELLLTVNWPIVMNKYDKAENIIVSSYFVLKMGYHIVHLNKSYHEFLCDLQSEFWAGVFTFIILGILFIFQIINYFRYVEKR
jgi:hypothetical protein